MPANRSENYLAAAALRLGRAHCFHSLLRAALLVCVFFTLICGLTFVALCSFVAWHVSLCADLLARIDPCVRIHTLAVVAFRDFLIW